MLALLVMLTSICVAIYAGLLYVWRAVALTYASPFLAQLQNLSRTWSLGMSLEMSHGVECGMEWAVGLSRAVGLPGVWRCLCNSSMHRIYVHCIFKPNVTV